MSTTIANGHPVDELEEPLERGRAELRPEPPVEQDRTGGPPPPRDPGRGWDGFPRFRGGDGNGLPRWQRIAIFGVMLFLSMLAGWFLGSAARIFARGLETSRP